ncbi:MAG TPA: TOMM precursor leader peptide-binding protein [Anaerolineae bacterium]|nr:TOMM precursor leader peptide-binding protein [Anaerolineae bacterium]
MPYKPQLKHHFRWEILPDTGVLLLSEQGHYLLNGQAYIHLLPLLHGQLTDTEIVTQLADKVPPSELFYALDSLQKRGYISDAFTAIPTSISAFWELSQVHPPIAENKWQTTPLTIHTLGHIDPLPFTQFLTNLGFTITPDAAHKVVLVDDYLQRDLSHINQDAIANKQSWLLAKPLGVDAWLGPLFVPGETACWLCLAHRLRGHRKVEHFLQTQKRNPNPFPTSRALLPATQHAIWGFLATEITKWLVVQRPAGLYGQLISWNAFSLQTTTHRLIKRPQCPHCGDEELISRQQYQPIELAPRPKAFTADGGHRGASPQETYQRFEHHISPITGLVSGIELTAKRDDKDHLLFSYRTDHNFVHMSNNLFFLRASLRSHSGGKGKTDIQARTSALGESIERYSGVFQGDEARQQATLADLGDQAIHPHQLNLFSQRQYQNRAHWNKIGEMFSWVGQPFNEDATIDWSPVWSLTHGQQKFVPTPFCYYGYPWQGQPQFTRADSNGCAAGNTREEAILQGFMELVERDAVALWWWNRLPRPGVDLNSFDDPYFAELLDHFHQRGRELWALDLTSDFGIPAFTAISRRTDHPTEDIIFGFGAHFDPKIALLRALTEHNQFIPNAYIPPNATPHVIYDWFRHATATNQPYLPPAPNLPLKKAADYPHHWSNDIRDDIHQCIQIAAQNDLETLVLDQTRPDTGLHVVKVIIPNIRHFWARFAPGRLYDVPVKMGWLSTPTAETDLNPNLMFV